MGLTIEEILEAMKFRTGRITFPGIKISATLKPNQYFLNEGPVEDMQKNYEEWKELLKEVDRPYDSEEILGECLRGELVSGHQFVIMYYLKNQESSTYILGHESTHSLIWFGLGNKLVDALEKEGFNFNPFEYYDDEEDIANVGGILASYREEKRMAKDFSELMNFRYFIMSHMEKDLEEEF